MKPLYFVLMALFGASLLACAPSGSTTKAATPAFDLQETIRSAKTPEDHQRIAAYYEQEAAEYKQKAAEHERIGKAYIHYVEPFYQPGHDMAKYSAHCQNLARMFSQAAEEYLSLAREHRRLAE